MLNYNIEDMVKECIKCLKTKNIYEFTKSKKGKDGHTNQCKSCRCEYIKLYRSKYPDKIRESNRRYRKNNPDKFLQSQEKWKKNNEDYQKLWYENNKEHKLKVGKDWYEKNKKRKLLTNKKWHEDNKDLVKEYRRNWSKNKRDTDYLFKITENIKSRIRKSLSEKKFRKTSNTTQILGCSYQELKIYLESKFETWMSWENYGKYNGEFNYGWDLDHLIPLSSAKNEEEVIRLNHYTNLQPLCSRINRDIKRSNICQN